MPYDPDRHRRRSIRLPGYDYTQPGAYFVTICTHEQESLFGEVVDGEMQLSPFGRVVDWYWQRIPRYFGHVRLDVWVVMPNHVHGVLWIVDDDAVGAMHPATKVAASKAFVSDDPSRITGGDLGGASPLPPRPSGAPSGSLGAIIGNFKSVTARRINRMRGTPGAPVWQRNYYEHIIRDERALHAIRRYIVENPLRWHLDRYNADREGPDPLAAEIWRVMQEAATQRPVSRPPIADEGERGGEER